MKEKSKGEGGCEEESRGGEERIRGRIGEV